MVAYYTRLAAGEGRMEALRQAQLEFIRRGVETQATQLRDLGGMARTTGDFGHPFYWAAFIQSGDWRDMNTPAARH